METTDQIKARTFLAEIAAHQAVWQEVQEQAQREYAYLKKTKEHWDAIRPANCPRYLYLEAGRLARKQFEAGMESPDLSSLVGK